MDVRPTEQMKPQSAKAKGRKFQQEVKAMIHEVFPSLEDGDVRSCSMGSGGEDLQLSPAARKHLPFSIECKHRAKIAVFQDYAQAKSHGKHEPVVFLRQNHSIPLALVSAQYFFTLVAK